MKPEIKLPPKVKCWRCIEGQVTVVVGRILPGPDIPEDMEGTPLLGFESCDCDDGERYVFDDLARAVTEAGYSWERLIESQPQGIAPTAALLNAITKFNE